MKTISPAALLLALAACQDPKNAITGQWQGTEWFFMGKPSGQDATLVHFDFKEDGTYNAHFGEQKISGNWRRDKDKLYTTQAGRPELEIKLLQADGTVLQIEMDIHGNKEVIKFKRE